MESRPSTGDHTLTLAYPDTLDLADPSRDVLLLQSRTSIGKRENGTEYRTHPTPTMKDQVCISWARSDAPTPRWRGATNSRARAALSSCTARVT